MTTMLGILPNSGAKQPSRGIINNSGINHQQKMFHAVIVKEQIGRVGESRATIIPFSYWG